MVYLLDYVHYQHFGETVTGLEYQWDHYGPNAVQHQIVRVAEDLAEKNQITYRKVDYWHGGVTKYFGATPDSEIPTLDATAEMVLNDVVARYGRLSVKEVTEVSKKTLPFKNASQYDMLTMEQLAPALGATADDVEAYNRDLAEHGVLTLEQVKREYGLE